MRMVFNPKLTNKTPRPYNLSVKKKVAAELRFERVTPEPNCQIHPGLLEAGPWGHID